MTCIRLRCALAFFGCLVAAGIANADFRLGLFGTGASGAVVADANATVARRILLWAEGEPERGVYDFSITDAMVQSMGQYGVDVILTLRPNDPRYLRMDVPDEGDDSKYSAYPAEIGQWLSYVHAIVERYDGDGVNDMPELIRPVMAYQIENEWIGPWVDTDESLYELIERTSTLIRSAAPGAVIVGPAVGHWNLRVFALGAGIDPRDEVRTGFQNDPRIVTREQAIAQMQQEDGAYRRTVRLFEAVGDSYDVLDIHVYATIREEVEWWTQWARDTLDDAGLKSQPIWSLEFGLPFFDYTELSHSRLLSQSFATAMASGLEVVCYSTLYPMINIAFWQFALLDGAAARTIYFNYRQAARAFVGAVWIEEIGSLSSRVYEIRRRDGTFAWVGWTEGLLWSPIDLPLVGTGVAYPIIKPGSTEMDSGIDVRGVGGLLRVPLTQSPLVVIETGG